jgi:flavin-dependent dehydrogenase
VATGRSASAPKGNRLFGFKAHFRGPVNDAVEMFFLNGRAYVGVSPVEDGFTNVCGLAEEHVLAAYNFEIDEYLRRHRPLRERLEPLERVWDWLTTGPLVFQHQLRSPAEPGLYRAGDALSFIDPFTGSGILTALFTGSEAGRAAARRQAPEEHLRLCRSRLLPPFQATSFFRKALVDGWGQWIAPWLPSPALFHLTRPRV